MAISINVNGTTIDYPETGDTNWSDEATNFAVQTSSALGKIGLSSGTSVDIQSTLDVTGATTLDSTLTVAGTTTLNGTANLNGNNNLGNATSDTTAVTGILNVDSGVLYVDPTNNRVGVNKTSPAQALDVVGNFALSGNETVGGTLDVTGNVTLSSTLGVTGNTTLTGDLNVNGNTTIGNANTDTTTINGTTVSVPNGLNIDSGTFVIDATNNRIGINNGSPSVALDLIGVLKLRTSSASGYGYTQFGNSSTSTQNWHAGSEGDGNFKIYNGNVGTGVNALQIASNGQLSAVIPSGSTLYPGYLCRAWVNFNGTGSVGSQTIRGSGNVSSVSKTGTGQYTVNIDTDMPDANYAVTVSTGLASTGSGGTQNEDTYVNTYLAGSFVITTANNGTLTDMVFVAAAVFR